MNEQFNTGDKVTYEDAYTGEIKFGLITNMSGGDAIIRTITEQEAGRNPKRLPKLQIACSVARDDDGRAICQYHRQVLQQLELHGEPNPPGLGHISAGICPVSGKSVLTTDGF